MKATPVVVDISNYRPSEMHNYNTATGRLGFVPLGIPKGNESGMVFVVDAPMFGVARVAGSMATGLLDVGSGTYFDFLRFRAYSLSECGKIAEENRIGAMNAATGIADPDRPKIVCLLGSGRFRDAYEAANIAEAKAGNIVLSISGTINPDPNLKTHLLFLHRKKIRLADEVLVLNVGGYIGESTAAEIMFARSLGKPIRYLELCKGGSPNGKTFDNPGHGCRDGFPTGQLQESCDNIQPQQTQAAPINAQPIDKRARIYLAIGRERSYQDRKWGPADRHPVGSYLTILRHQLAKAEAAWHDNQGDIAALEYVLQVAAVAVACMEAHGFAHPRHGDVNATNGSFGTDVPS